MAQAFFAVKATFRIPRDHVRDMSLSRFQFAFALCVIMAGASIPSFEPLQTDGFGEAPKSCEQTCDESVPGTSKPDSCDHLASSTLFVNGSEIPSPKQAVHVCKIL